MREVLINWTFAGGQPSVSVMHFDESLTADEQLDQLDDFLGGVKLLFGDTTQYSIPSEGKIIEASTGTLTGGWTATGTRGGAGTGSGKTVPNSSMLLVRFGTEDIVNGRRLKGRWYIPGCVAGQIGDLGEVSAFAVDTIVSAGTGLITPPGLLVWHRPGPKGPGSAAVVTQVSAWNEWATQRDRR
uniref:Uncharacterized protein n=1 Tax=uncultured prokaryote TaxID=198431 RepID=A0A0H5Q7X3_9ZZZZ|nr:hypothetical protein [uncultured prokaryote]